MRTVSFSIFLEGYIVLVEIVYVDMYRGEVAGTVLGGDAVDIIGGVVEVLGRVVPEGRTVVVGCIDCHLVGGGEEECGGSVAIPADGDAILLRCTDSAPGAIRHDGVVADGRCGREESINDRRLTGLGLGSRVVGLGNVVEVIDPTHKAELDVDRLVGGIEVGRLREVDGGRLTH